MYPKSDSPTKIIQKKIYEFFPEEGTPGRDLKKTSATETAAGGVQEDILKPSQAMKSADAFDETFDSILEKDHTPQTSAVTQSQRMGKFLETHMTQFSSPAVYIFEILCEEKPELELNDAYTKYLRQVTHEIRDALLQNEENAVPLGHKELINEILLRKKLIVNQELLDQISVLLKKSSKKTSGNQRAAKSAPDYPSFCNKHLMDLMRKNCDSKKLSHKSLAQDLITRLSQGEITLEQAVMLQEDCLVPLRKFNTNYWRTHLHEKKGYQFYGNKSLLYSIRNIVFHLAFTLELRPETVSKILTKCLLQQDFNPKSHQEAIYLWCLHRNISYEDMISDYFVYYHSPEFAKCYRDLTSVEGKFYRTEILFNQLQEILADDSSAATAAQREAQKEAFFKYLKKIYILEKNIQNYEHLSLKTELCRKDCYQDLFTCIFRNDRELALDRKYTDESLSTVLPGVNGVRPVKNCSDFYKGRILEKCDAAGMSEEACKPTIARLTAERKLRKEHLPRIREDYQKPLKRFLEGAWAKPSGSSCFALEIPAYSVRNAVYHLAFALGLDLDTTDTLLGRCLQMPDHDPVNHLEVIYRWCLKRHISYRDMVTNYILLYHSVSFDKDCQLLKKTSRSSVSRQSARSVLEGILDNRNYSSPEQQEQDFIVYLKKLKILEQDISRCNWLPTAAQLTRKTVQELFSSYFDNFPEDYSTDPELGSPVYSYGNITWSWRSPESGPLTPLPSRQAEEADPDSEEDAEENIIRRQLKLLEQARKDYYEKNEEELLPLSLLEDLFSKIQYTEAQVLKRKGGSVPVSRDLLIATMFIGYLSCEPLDSGSTIKNLTSFENEISLELEECGLFPFYHRNPFELFLSLCFVTKDPLGYFMSNWEHFLRNTQPQKTSSEKEDGDPEDYPD